MVTAIGNSDGLWNLCANAAANRFCQHSRNTAMTVRDGHRPVKQDTVCGCMMLSVQRVYLLISMTERELMRIFSQAVLHFYRDWIESLHVQQLIPVPLSRRKQRQRGFNQAALLAEKIAEGLSLPVNTRGLRRIHSTAPQKKLGKYERGENLKHAFVADARYLQGVRRVLLIDDIYTTGSTVNYCAGALKQAGIEKVWFLTLCTGGVF